MRIIAILFSALIGAIFADPPPLSASTTTCSRYCSVCGCTTVTVPCPKEKKITEEKPTEEKPTEEETTEEETTEEDITQEDITQEETTEEETTEEETTEEETTEEKPTQEGTTEEETTEEETTEEGTDERGEDNDGGRGGGNNGGSGGSGGNGNNGGDNKDEDKKDDDDGDDVGETQPEPDPVPENRPPPDEAEPAPICTDGIASCTVTDNRPASYNQENIHGGFFVHQYAFHNGRFGDDKEFFEKYLGGCSSQTSHTPCRSTFGEYGCYAVSLISQQLRAIGALRSQGVNIPLPTEELIQQIIINVTDAGALTAEATVADHPNFMRIGLETILDSCGTPCAAAMVSYEVTRLDGREDQTILRKTTHRPGSVIHMRNYITRKYHAVTNITPAAIDEKGKFINKITALISSFDPSKSAVTGAAGINSYLVLTTSRKNFVPIHVSLLTITIGSKTIELDLPHMYRRGGERGGRR